jgi:pimeloyl-ACP methyl ester carboxylesterase
MNTLNFNLHKSPINGSAHPRIKRNLAIAIAVTILSSCVALWVIGGSLAAPQNRIIGEIPSDLTGRGVQFKSQSGSMLQGWFIPGRNGMGTVILMHGVRANRLSMLNRARFLARAGYSVLLFDFQAHGESSGEYITFGYLESKDAQAAVEFLHQNNQRDKIGVIGISMGGAASLLATPSLEVDALILESVYPTIEEAISDRITMRLGRLGTIFTPLLTFQLKPRLGVGPEELRPIEKAAKVTLPKYFIFGTEDRHTRIDESRKLFAHAAAPKEAWAIDGAGHVDLHQFSQDEYEKRVLDFLARYLR